MNRYSKHRTLAVMAILLAIIGQFIPYRLTFSINEPNPESVANFSQYQTLPWPTITDIGTVQATGGLTITKISHPSSPAIVDQGELLTYTLILTNNTGLDLDNLVITDRVPLHTECAALIKPAGWFSNEGNCDQAGEVMWASQSNTLPNAASLNLDFSVRVAKPLAYQTVITNHDYRILARAVGSGTPFEDVGLVAVSTPVDSPRWAISKQVQPGDTVQAGNNLDYTIAVTNTGSLKTTGLFTITEVLPNNAALVANPDGATVNGSTLSWVFTDTKLNPAELIAVHFSVQVDKPLTDGTVISNDTYQVDGGEAVGPVAGAPISVTVMAAADLTLDKVADRSIVLAGESILYSLTYQNQGNEVSGNYVVSDTIPAGTTFLDSTAFTSFDGDRTYQWTGSNLSPLDGPQVITISLKADDGLSNGTLLTNQATISSTDGSFATASALVTVDSRPDLIVSQSLTAARTPIRAGDRLTYTIAYTNLGRTTLDSLRITDTLPSRVTILGVQPGATANVQASPLVFVQSNLAELQSGLITITAIVDETPWPAAGLALTNVVMGSGTPTESVTANNVSTLTTTIWPDLPAQINAASNSPASIAGSLLITATIRDGFDNPVADNTAVTFQSDAVNSSINSTGLTQNGLVTASVTTAISQTATLTITADSASTALEIAFAEPELAISKISNPSHVAAGGTLVYQIVISNTGMVAAEQVQLEDDIDPNLSVVETSHPSTQNGSVYRFNLPDLAVGMQETVFITATTGAGLANNTLITNTATVTASQLAALQTASAVSQISNILLEVDVTPNPVRAGQLLTYTIRHRNDSAQMINSLRLTSTLPAQVAQVVIIDQGTASLIDGTLPMLVFSRNNVPAGQQTLITVTTRVMNKPWGAALANLTNEVNALATLADNGQMHLTTYAPSQGGPDLPATIQLAYPSSALLSQTVPVTISIQDQFGNPVLDGTALSISGPTHLTIDGDNTTTNGQAVATVQSAQAGLSTVTVSVNSLNAQAEINFAAASQHVYLPVVTK